MKKVLVLFLSIFAISIFSMPVLASDISANSCKSGGCTATYDSTTDVVSIELGSTAKDPTIIELSNGVDADYLGAAKTGKTYTASTYSELGTGRAYILGSWSSKVYHNPDTKPATAPVKPTKGDSTDLPSDYIAE